MPVLSRTRKNVETDSETETKAEPKVIVDKGLATLVTEWEQADKKADSYFPKVCQYVIDNEVSRAELKKALMDIRHMQELTANNEVSKIFKASERPELVERTLKNKMSVRELREAVTKKQEGTDDAETKFKKGFRRLAMVAISELEFDDREFSIESKRAYKDAYARLEAKEAKTDEEGEQEGSEGEEEE